MIDEKSSSEFDDVFRELENLPEEKPSVRDWEQMSKRIQSEGLLESNSNGRKYFFLILLLALLSALVSLPFIIKNKNESLKTEVVRPVVKIQSNDPKNTSKKFETKNVTAAQPDVGAKTGSDNESSSTHHLSSEHTIQNVVAVNANHDRAKQNSSDRGEANENAGDENKAGSKNATASGEKQNRDENASGEKSNSSTAMHSDAQSQNNSGNGEATTGSNGQGASAQSSATDEKNLSSIPASTDSINAAAQQLPADSLSKNSLTHDSTGAHDALTFKRFRLGIYVSLDYNYYTLKENNNVAHAESEYVRQSGSIIGDKWGGQYTVGIMGGYMFTKKLSLETGVFYSQKKKLHADIYTPTYTGNSDEELFSDFTYDYQARYFEIYGRVKYYFLQRKNSFYVTAGATGSYNLPASNENSDYFSRTSYTRSSAETEHVKLDASSASAVMVISAGMEIPVGTKWVAYIEPAYRYSFNPVVKHPTYDRLPVEHFLRCLSLATGLMYKF